MLVIFRMGKHKKERSEKEGSSDSSGLDLPDEIYNDDVDFKDEDQEMSDGELPLKTDKVSSSFKVSLFL